MRLGAPVTGFETGEQWALAHVEKGYGAAYWPLQDDERLDEYVEAARRHDLVIAEVGVWRNLLDPDEKKRAENMEYALRRLITAEKVGARCCVNISGSVSPVWDGPHPDNLTQKTFDRIVACVRELIDAVKPKRTVYALEPMPWMYPTDLESTERLIEAVDRRAFGVHVDMCNMMNTPEKVFRSGEVTRAYFEGLGDAIHSVHAKDVTLSTKLTTHIDEALPGEGVFDFGELLRQCAKLDDVCVMAEHLSTGEQYDRATAFLRAEAERQGLTFESAK